MKKPIAQKLDRIWLKPAKYCVSFSQVNQSNVNVFACSEEEAREKAYRIWRKEYAQTYVTYIEKNGEPIR